MLHKTIAIFQWFLKVKTELLRVQKALNEKEIYPRRYFYPSLDTLRVYRAKTRVRNLKRYKQKSALFTCFCRICKNIDQNEHN